MDITVTSIDQSPDNPESYTVKLSVDGEVHAFSADLAQTELEDSVKMDSLQWRPDADWQRLTASWDIALVLNLGDAVRAVKSGVPISFPHELSADLPPDTEVHQAGPEVDTPGRLATMIRSIFGKD